MHFLALEQKGKESIFYHMLGSLVIEALHNSAPFFSIIQNTLNQSGIFFIRPFVMLDRSVEMIKPSLSALFAVSEKFLFGFNEELNGDFVPLGLFLFSACDQRKQFVFILLPFLLE